MSNAGDYAFDIDGDFGMTQKHYGKAAGGDATAAVRLQPRDANTHIVNHLRPCLRSCNGGYRVRLASLS
jgi:hypothetical protein